MLPNRMNLPKQTEERLRRLKQHTGISPNVSSRIAFFRSYGKGFTYRNSEIKLDGSLTLDKITWLGETGIYIELLLKEKYPNLEGKELAKAWAAHVSEGIMSIGNLKGLHEFAHVMSATIATVQGDSI